MSTETMELWPGSELTMERNLALELVRVTEAAALAAARENGRGDEMAPERAATEAMHKAWNSITVQGEIVVGDPQQVSGDLARFGLVARGRRPPSGHRRRPARGRHQLCARRAERDVDRRRWRRRVRCCAARTPTWRRSRLPATARGVVDLDKSPAENLRALAEMRSVYVEDLTVVVLDRPRHDTLIEEIRTAGARVRLIPHGDVAAAMAAASAGFRRRHAARDGRVLAGHSFRRRRQVHRRLHPMPLPAP